MLEVELKKQGKISRLTNKTFQFPKELGTNEEETILVLDEDEQVGTNFFSLEENL